MYPVYMGLRSINQVCTLGIIMKMMRIVLEVTAGELAREVDRVVEGDDRMLLFDFLSSIEIKYKVDYHFRLSSIHRYLRTCLRSIN